MLGLFGTSIIGTNHLTGPIADTESKSARFARHEPVRGKPVFQDLGDDANTKQLNFFFDEVFCNPEVELGKINLAYKTRIPMRLFIDLVGFEVNVFLIERLRVTTKKTTPSGRVVRVELQVDLIESTLDVTGLRNAAAGLARAIRNPFIRRG